jgi:hypothetical protein
MVAGTTGEGAAQTLFGLLAWALVATEVAGTTGECTAMGSVRFSAWVQAANVVEGPPLQWLSEATPTERTEAKAAPSPFVPANAVAG